ncbi:MAG: RagB/SusD family nutrient uptake outer membrane protein [Bacteroidales bacterium]|nr:RagB/SusD family nutrient uptake outer membrane protein [Bacteroidales bacterium]
MKKYIYILASVFLLTIGTTSCGEEYLDVSSPSQVDEDFVFSTPDEAYKVLMGCYEIFRGQSYVHSNGLFYDLIIGGSDSECHPEAYAAQQRHVPEGLYADEDFSIDFNDFKNVWKYCYQMANRLAIVIAQIESKPAFQTAWDAQEVSEWTQLYGEAVTMRAIAYHELIRFFGDIPYFEEPIYTQDQSDVGVTSRFDIYDNLLADLKMVEPFMYRLNEGGVNGERITGTFVQGFIGRLALYAGGYQLFRSDFDYGVTLEKHTSISGEKWNAIYARHPDYLDYYRIAEEYLEDCVTEGKAVLITADERGYGNPFQRNFQYMMDLQVSPESLFEIAETQGQQTERPYAFGRPSKGGGSNNFPCKSYGQSRIYASFYYGDFDPLDLRRDASVAVTCNQHPCTETLLLFDPGSQNKGGLANNKWDESRMTNPWTTKQRQSGINTCYLRMADVILMLSEVYAELGKEGPAKTELAKVRERAFPATAKAVKVDAYIAALSGDALKEAIAQERKLEFAGEGLRRYDLIRTGKLPEKIVALRDAQEAMINGLKTQGYYTFDNGNTIPAYIYTKRVNTADLAMSYMLTKQCDVLPGDPTYPVKFPSWRGQHDGWEGYDNTSGDRNLAIQGLFEFIDSAGVQGTALIAAGYEVVPWGSTIVSYEDQYLNDIFKGYTDADYAAKTPPRYICPMSSTTISKSNGKITNGYGFAQE